VCGLCLLLYGGYVFYCVAVVFVIVWGLCLLLWGVVFFIVGVVFVIVWGCVCYCGSCLLLCGVVFFIVGVVFVIVWGCVCYCGCCACYCVGLCLLLWGLCFLLSFSLGCSNIITLFGIRLVRLEVGDSSGVVYANLRLVH